MADMDVDMMPVETIQDEQLLAAAVSEIERFRTLDCVIPTYHNIVTISCIKVSHNWDAKEPCVANTCH